MAKTMALAPQLRPSSKQDWAIASKEAPPPPSDSGTKAESRRSSRSAATASAGKRASRSTASALGAATSVAIRFTAASRSWSRPATATLIPPRS